ncbi:VWA domain-containing protein [Candidatus Marinimicrobia bacterium MT.SAG.3]|nr:VWA domain-containing protein [Candidatus Marinimicrobia bacterium MT.SAG.3]
MITFENISFLWLLLAVPSYLVWYVRRNDVNRSKLRFSETAIFGIIQKRAVPLKVHLPFALRLLAIALLIVGFARPRSGVTNQEVTTEGIDIMLVLDISSSMEARDFRPNRLEAAKKVAEHFIDNRVNDRIGLVVFASETFVQAPLTLDYDILRQFLRKVTIVPKKYDGTAIGLAIASGVNRLKNSDAKSKVMILLSDGSNNSGEIQPITAAELAAAFDVKIYTVGAGTRDRRLLQSGLDEAVLRQIAETTNGKYYHASNEERLLDIYEEINELEKTEIKVKEYTRYKELYSSFLLPGVLLLLMEIFTGLTYSRRLP